MWSDQGLPRSGVRVPCCVLSDSHAVNEHPKRPSTRTCQPSRSSACQTPRAPSLFRACSSSCSLARPARYWLPGRLVACLLACGLFCCCASRVGDKHKARGLWSADSTGRSAAARTQCQSHSDGAREQTMPAAKAARSADLVFLG